MPLTAKSEPPSQRSCSRASWSATTASSRTSCSTSSSALGYGGSKPDAAERVGRSGDGGIDGVIREDKLGLDAIYVQAKKWAPDRNVGPREIREFLGALQDVEAAKGIFITTSSFSQDARELARRRRIVLMDGVELATRMVEAGVGVTTVQAYELKRIDEDYFAEVE
jgi:restriction system protein